MQIPFFSVALFSSWLPSQPSEVPPPPPVAIVVDKMLFRSAGVLSSLVALTHAGSTYQPTWYPPLIDENANLSKVLNGTDAPGIYTSSHTPDKLYGTYNWCNMPHVRKTEYPIPKDKSWGLQYVEVIHRHHKRTPYQSNTFPVEDIPWNCNGAYPAHYLSSDYPHSPSDAEISWKAYTDPHNPFTHTVPPGFNNSDCQFPQITAEGLQDSFEHGVDLAGVYRDKLGFLPKKLDPSKHSFRVTNNVITSQVLGSLITGVFPDTTRTGYEAYIQSSSYDSLEPTYSCAYANTVLAQYQSSTNATWLKHLDLAQGLYNRLDAVSGIANPDDGGFHTSFDHYYDNLSAKQCHQKSLPCNVNRTQLCVSQADANEVYRLGQYEYYYKFRGSASATTYSTLRSAAFLMELRAHLSNESNVGGYRHNVAHDGSMALLLGALQVKQMVWPGLGSELVFEMWRNQKSGQKALRILFGGKPLVTSGPLGTVDLIAVQTFYDYLDAQLPKDLVAACSN